MKDYKKIYNRLIKEIKFELNCHKIALSKNTLDDFKEYIENSYAVTVLNWVLSILPELEGKKCYQIVMNQEEFKKWKKTIQK